MSFAENGPTDCPNCGCDYLHQRRVRIFNRDEDAEAGTAVDVDGCEVRVFANMDGNPSSRRDGILISFECESCEVVSEMEIIQHKGQTFIAWKS